MHLSISCLTRGCGGIQGIQQKFPTPGTKLAVKSPPHGREFDTLRMAKATPNNISVPVHRQWIGQCQGWGQEAMSNLNLGRGAWN